MYGSLGITAVLLTAAWITLPARDRSATEVAMERARFAWDKGAYVDALTTYRELLSGPDASSVLEPIALQTGELFKTTELTRDGASPAFSPDSRFFSFETGPAVSAGVASGVGRTTHVRAVTAPDTDITALDGGEASFCPDGRTVAFVRVPATPAITTAQAALIAAAAGSAQERAPRQQALARLIARDGQIVIRDIASGADQVLNSGDMLKTALTCAADGNVLFAAAAAAETDTVATQIYAAHAGADPR